MITKNNVYMRISTKSKTWIMENLKISRNFYAYTNFWWLKFFYYVKVWVLSYRTVYNNYFFFYFWKKTPQKWLRNENAENVGLVNLLTCASLIGWCTFYIIPFNKKKKAEWMTWCKEIEMMMENAFNIMFENSAAFV